MAVYTKEQNELVNVIRKLQKDVEKLTYEQHLQLCILIEGANAQNLCWW